MQCAKRGQIICPVTGCGVATCIVNAGSCCGVTGARDQKVDFSVRVKSLCDAGVVRSELHGARRAVGRRAAEPAAKNAVKIRDAEGSRVKA